MLLYRYTGQEEFAVGCSFLASPHEQDMAGNLVVLRVDLHDREAPDGQPTGREVLRQVSQALQKAPSAVLQQPACRASDVYVSLPASWFRG